MPTIPPEVVVASQVAREVTVAADRLHHRPAAIAARSRLMRAEVDVG